jgi:hypothetical protein
VIFKKAEKPKLGLRDSDSAEVELLRWARQIHGRALNAKREGRIDEALGLLDQVADRLQAAVDARSQQLGRLISETHVLRAIELDQAGRREEAMAVADLALDAIDVLEAQTEGDQRHIAVMLALRVRAAESTSMDESRLTRLLDDSTERIRHLPVNSERATLWLVWSRKLIATHLDRGRSADAVQVARRVVAGIPALKVSSSLDFNAVYAGMRLVHDVAVRIVEAGEPDLAGELVDECVRLRLA